LAHRAKGALAGRASTTLERGEALVALREAAQVAENGKRRAR
jgi:hypothetical protein